MIKYKANATYNANGEMINIPSYFCRFTISDALMQFGEWSKYYKLSATWIDVYEDSKKIGRFSVRRVKGSKNAWEVNPEFKPVK